MKIDILRRSDFTNVKKNWNENSLRDLECFETSKLSFNPNYKTLALASNLAHSTRIISDTVKFCVAYNLEYEPESQHIYSPNSHANLAAKLA